MERWSENPNQNPNPNFDNGSEKSFKIHRKSPLASKLKSMISSKLLQFLPNYNDDVLSEYIVVLVCNGKHQNEARDELEAFLGERSGEFVSWLWGHLLKYAPKEATRGSSDSKDAPVTSPYSSDADMDYKLNKTRDLGYYVDGHVDTSTNHEKLRNLSSYTYNPDPSIVEKLSEHTQFFHGHAVPLHEFTVKKSLLETRGRDIKRKFGATKVICDESLVYKSSKNREQNIQSVENVKGTRLSKISEFSFSENLDPGQVHVSKRSISPSADGALAPQNKTRGSVWDRLGKPCESTRIRSKLDAATEKTMEPVLDQCPSVLPVPVDESDASLAAEVLGCGNNKPGECQKMDHGVNNIRRKRHFGEISTGPGADSIHLAGETSLDLQHSEISQDFKRSVLISEASGATDPVKNEHVMSVNRKPTLVKALDLQRRLLQIEMDMTKLRTKQLQMKKNGKTNLPSGSGLLKHREEDADSRTVTVTNIHLAVSKEALSMFFANCGVVADVVFLTDIATAQLKRSAYITFSSKDSVDKAVALNGTSLFSRTLKVMRKAETDAVTSVHAPAPARNSRPHLQWRRDTISTTTREKGSADLGSEAQQPT